MPETPERSAMRVSTPERSAMRELTPPTMPVRAGAFPSLPGSPQDAVYHYLSSPVYLAELEELLENLEVIKGRIAYYKKYESFLPTQYASLIEGINENILEICGPDAESGLSPARLTFSDGAVGGKSKKKKSKKRRKTKKKRRKTNKKRRKTRY
jgi:hypothetical protein